MTFDLARTEELVRLFAVPRESRDDAWVSAFYDAVPDASMTAGTPQVMKGPDGFPYFVLRVPAPGAFEAFSVRHVLDVCLREGFGMCVFASQEAERPEWVFRYGDLWSFREQATFDPPVPPPGDGGSVLVASPSDVALPPYARAVLRRALEAIGAEPGVLLVTEPGGRRLLAFPVEDDRALDRLTWYVPRDYGVVGPGPGSSYEFGTL